MSGTIGSGVTTPPGRATLVADIDAADTEVTGTTGETGTDEGTSSDSISTPT
ncbi:hypothetical protein [Rhodococcus opacus]|uniref:hypothetical protein n=1 Tax=Rhodococcus opacus TaxID=37919 RepID=UPI00130DB234|nr:hypothetical protein [Rhodococcus opacus]